MRIVRKFGDMRHSVRGIRTVWREEWHFKYQILFALFAVTLAYCASATPTQLVLLVSALLITLASEIINTAIEDVCNFIQPGHDPRIGAIKDMAQAFVLVSALPSLLMFLWIIIPAIV